MNIYIHMYIIAGSTEAGLPVVVAVKLPATSRSSGSWLLNFEVAETRRYTCGRDLSSCLTLRISLLSMLYTHM